jgi:DNA transposition AAA+ family ATPase
MSQTETSHKVSSFAALRNVQALRQLILKVTERPVDLPGFGVLHGAAGLGKTKAAIYAKNKFNAPFISIGETWTKKSLLQKILQECGEHDVRGSTNDLADRCIRLLGETLDRPLIIDEADKLIDKNMIEVLRYIHDTSLVPVILIGEDRLPAKLQGIQRVHSRVLDWVQAMPCDAEDTAKLARAYAAVIKVGPNNFRQIEMAPDLLERVRTACGGNARLISTTINQISEFCINAGLTTIDAATYSGTIHTGEYRASSRRTA